VHRSGESAESDLGLSPSSADKKNSVAIIYKIHYDNVGKAYIGSSLRADPDYWGSMSPTGVTRMRDDHARVELPFERRREILWEGEPAASLLSREYAIIKAHRTNIPTHGYNLSRWWRL
jgi:hypothetical protein